MRSCTLILRLSSLFLRCQTSVPVDMSCMLMGAKPAGGPDGGSRLDNVAMAESTQLTD